MAEQLTPVEGIRRELQRGIRRYLTGRTDPPTNAPVEDGWFGPDSIAWLVQSDWSVLIGGVESLMLQTLHPPTMAGVADHSDYSNDFLGRLHRTGAFLGTTIYGSAADAQRAVDAVHAIHDRVTGTLDDGTPYRANDPRNLMWVHSTEVDGFLRAFRRYGAVPIDDDEADRYVAEMSVVGEALGIPRAPTTVAELDDTLRSYLPELRYGPQARDAMRFILFPPHSPAARAPYAVVTAAAITMLPSWARRKLWIPPAFRPVDSLLVEPAVAATLKTLDLIMQTPPRVSEIRARHLENRRASAQGGSSR